jgi:tripartite-type tricarboxylate transporter receptor subunit TctC
MSKRLQIVFATSVLLAPGMLHAQLHLTMELLKSMTGTQILHVAYKGTQQALSDVIGGQIHLVCNPIASILPQVKTGQVRALGVTSLTRSTAAPEIPTLDESGIRGYENIGWGGYVLPARAPREIVVRLNAEINKAYLSPTMVKAVADIGGTVIGGAPERLTQQIHKEIEIYGKLFKALGIAPQ